MALIIEFTRRIKSKTLTLTLTNPSLTLTHHQFSTSNSDEANSKSPFIPYFSNVKDRLQQKQPTTTSPLTKSPPFSKVDSLEHIPKIRSSAPAPGEPSPEPISFQDIYNRNVSQKSTRDMQRKLSCDAIRESMQQLRSSGTAQADRKAMDPLSLPSFRNSLNLNPSDSTSSSVIGGTGALPASFFAKEMREVKSSAAAAKTEFVKKYSFVELGTKLRTLRPEGNGRECFSLGELNERLMRLREMEEKEALSSIKGVPFKDLRESLTRLQVSDEEKAKKTLLRRLDILGHLGRTPTFMLEQPKEHLVERYFHPDNMSSAEKLKIELTKVRDEFKMSDSDCASARVQVAQLTTKIKHLSSVLQKKDKHSRKGLLAMVRRRKRLLKYLRSTDWDSYCFVISKLGLRDNPDVKY